MESTVSQYLVLGFDAGGDVLLEALLHLLHHLDVVQLGQVLVALVQSVLLNIAGLDTNDTCEQKNV